MFVNFKWLNFHHKAKHIFQTIYPIISLALMALQVNIGGKTVALRPVFCGTKGDWPFMRKVMKLATGFQARIRRKCHHCGCDETCMMIYKIFLKEKWNHHLYCIVSKSNRSFFSWASGQYKAWWDMSPTGPLRNLQAGYNNPSPFKVNSYSPLFGLPGGSAPHRIRTDPAHTYHIGYGKDENASILMVLVRIGHFGRRGSVDTKLERAFEKFATFCKINKKHTSIVEFSKKQFKISKGQLD